MTPTQADQTAALQFAEQRCRNLAEAIPHIVLRANPLGGLEYHNELWCIFTGMTSSESLGFGWQRAIFPEDLPLTLSEWSRAMREAGPFESEFRVRRYDGVYHWHWIKADPERDTGGNVVAWLATCTDIEELKKAQRNAETANDAKAHFLANMSHEIRTPLNAIMGFTELLLDPNISVEEQVKGVSIVRRNCHQLLRIFDEILDISKVEDGELVSEKSETSVKDLLNDVNASLLAQARKKEIELVFENDSCIPSSVLTDSARLRQIVLNIVGNALKFTQCGSVSVSSRFAITMEGHSMLYITVSDTGVGIDAKSAEYLFRPFSQGDNSTTRVFGGTGLGLALARRLARAMGGDVRLIWSQPGQGSTFLISVQVEVLQERAGPRDIGSLSGKRILLVEDTEDNQFLIQQFLSRTGAILEVANNGEEGVAKALNNEYEVVLMDIQMPLVDGYQATSRLRAAGYQKPIIALTAHALIEEREKCLRTGCTGHLTKPIDRRQLIESLIDIIDV